MRQKAGEEPGNEARKLHMHAHHVLITQSIQ